MRDDNSQQQIEQEQHEWWTEQMEHNTALFEAGKLGHQYADYIMQHCGGDRIICNGDTLVDAIEDQYLLDDFLDSLLVIGEKK